MDDEWITPSEILLGGPPWGTTPYNIIIPLFCLVLQLGIPTILESQDEGEDGESDGRPQRSFQ